MTKSTKAVRKPAPPKPEVVEIGLRPVKDDPLKRSCGSDYPVWNQALAEATRRTAYFNTGEGWDPKTERSKTIQTTVLALEAFKPADPVEAMMAAQAVGLHNAAMECMRRAMLPNQPFEFASKMRREAANLSRAMIDMCEALDRRRGKGPQIVRVERVVVHEGGQAVVGNVSTGSAKAIECGAEPMVLAEPEIAKVAKDSGEDRGMGREGL